jgi:hypothetical protein
MDFKVGDRVKLNLEKEIEKETKGKRKERKQPEMINLWKALHGRIGIISRIVSDDEIWVKGEQHSMERMFNRHVIERIEE